MLPALAPMSGVTACGVADDEVTGDAADRTDNFENRHDDGAALDKVLADDPGCSDIGS